MDPLPSLRKIFDGPHPPVPWESGHQIPWDDPEFSERMLLVHLDPTTDMASRNPEMIDKHVAWLNQRLKPGSRVLDIGCGPGLYSHELARLGHTPVGFDFAPAPLKWARAKATAENLDCTFHHLDLTNLPDGLPEKLGGSFDAVTFWFGEFHSFPPEAVQDFLPRLHRCLKPGGQFILEYQPDDIFVKEESSDWSTQEKSVFCDRPHLWLQEFGWDDETATETHVHWILATESGKLDRYIQCHKAWTDAELIALLAAAGFGDPQFHPPITGDSEEFEFPLVVTRA